jgi:HD-GYP domain-containing protein (c-di-GMP phosphodiesterase class II)
MVFAGERPPRVDSGSDAVPVSLRRAPSEAQSVYAPFPGIVQVVRTRANHALTVVLAEQTLWERDPKLFAPYTEALAAKRATLILLGDHSGATREKRERFSVDRALALGVAAIVNAEAGDDELALAITRAFEALELRGHATSSGASIEQYRSQLDELAQIARAMTTARDVDKLLAVILEKSRLVTGADAGSLYVLESDESGKSQRLRFKMSQNDSVQFDSREFTMPLSATSIAGAVALERRAIAIRDVYEIPAGAPYRFDRRIDEKSGYRTKSMLTVPLVSQRDECVGVIQLINKKRDPRVRLRDDETVRREVVPFDQRSEELLATVAAQAGISLENALLYDEIRKLFEGFVAASVEAIESRDPTTSGHSRRVADLTVGLAKTVDGISDGPFAALAFTVGDLRELEYASLLHDFGKIGVREKVLVKAKKLYDEQLELVRGRFAFVEQSLETDMLKRKIALLERRADPAEIAAIGVEFEEHRAHLRSSFQAILSANEPTVLAAGDFARVEAVAKESYFDLQGNLRPLLEQEELEALSIKRGSLTGPEYAEICSHVEHTFKFLSQIPWGKQLRRVPLIAGAHHERINGTGYPNRLNAEEIPVQSKMMAIADVFDALTASDRPYKKAVPLVRALDILELGVKDGHLDGELVRIFREAEVHQLITTVV